MTKKWPVFDKNSVVAFSLMIYVFIKNYEHPSSHNDETAERIAGRLNMSACFCAMEDKNNPRRSPPETAFGYPRDFLGNRFVYLVVSPRTRGLSVGINMNPDKLCNFDCVYCEANRDIAPVQYELDINVMATELEKTLFLVHSGQVRRLHPYSRLGSDLLKLGQVALSGDGEPTLCPQFSEAVEAVVHLRARGFFPFFKMALLTNGTGLDSPSVTKGLQYFTRNDEVWIKLDAGTQAYMDKVNRSEVSLDKILHNALELGRRRPIVIQSLFPAIDGQEPPPEEIAEYINRLNELKTGGAKIELVQIYSATRPIAHVECGHLPLRTLSAISRRVRMDTGLEVEVF
jgi:wyosine [tRNA(Phe)-imidazoG37] synthetase (radical SAM superfamily)